MNVLLPIGAGYIVIIFATMFFIGRFGQLFVDFLESELEEDDGSPSGMVLAASLFWPFFWVGLVFFKVVTVGAQPFIRLGAALWRLSREDTSASGTGKAEAIPGDLRKEAIRNRAVAIQREDGE